MRVNVNVKNIPDELKARDRWVLWKAESPDGGGGGEKKLTKVPYSLRGKRARVNDPRTWGSFEQCYAHYSKNDRYSGIGFVFSSEDDIIGIDLDHCRDAVSGQITAHAWKIITDTNSYAEVSVSGTGVHIILKGKIPGRSRRRGSIEMYDGGRFFVMTGEHVDGTPRTVERRQGELDELYKEIFPDAEESHNHNVGEITMDPRITRVLLICKLFEHTAGSFDWVNGFRALARSWGFNDDEITNSARYLEGKGYVETSEHNDTDDPVGPIRLTPLGSEYVLGIDCKRVEEFAKR